MLLCLQEGARGTGVSLLKRFARELKRLDEVRGSSIPATERLGEHFEFDTEQLRMRKLRQFSSDGVSPLAAPAGDEDIPAELTLVRCCHAGSIRLGCGGENLVFPCDTYVIHEPYML